MLMFTTVDASPAGLPSEKRVPIPITTVGGLHHIEKLVHLGSLPGGAETRAVRQRMAVRRWLPCRPQT